jgi:heptosyltransferase-2
MAGDGSIRRLVVRPPNWLGDAVLALPALAAIRRHFPASELTIAAPKSVAALFRENTPAAPDQILELPAVSRDAKIALAASAFDAGILFPNSFRSAWQFYRAGVRERWGYPTSGRSLLLTRRSRRPATPASPHQSEYYRDLVRGLDIPVSTDERPAMRASERSLALADLLLTRARWTHDAATVVLLPGAAYGQAKQWPPDRMAELAARLIREHGVWCVMGGAVHDRPAARAIESWLRAKAPETMTRLVDLVGRTDLGALAGVLARAAVCVSNDSGGMHLASAIGRPVVAIFGPTNERATSPTGDHDLILEPVFCRPCMLRSCPIDHRCMTRIAVTRVFDAVSRRLTDGGSA